MDVKSGHLNALINALSLVVPRYVRPNIEGEIIKEALDALHPNSVAQNGKACHREDFDLMLEAVVAWAAQRKWPALSFFHSHPKENEDTEIFLDLLKDELQEVYRVAIVGFSKSTERKAAWLVISSVDDSFLYVWTDIRKCGLIHRKDIALGKAQGWSIDDTFILHRSHLGE